MEDGKANFVIQIKLVRIGGADDQAADIRGLRHAAPPILPGFATIQRAEEANGSTQVNRLRRARVKDDTANALYVRINWGQPETVAVIARDKQTVIRADIQFAGRMRIG